MHSTGPARSCEELRELDGRILALRLERQYVTGSHLGLRLDARIAELTARRAELAETMVGTSPATGARTASRLSGINSTVGAAA